MADDDRTDGQDPWSDLRSSELWPRAKQYVEHRLRGQGQRLAVAEAELQALRETASEAQQRAEMSGAALLEAEQLKASISAHVEALSSRIPEGARSLIPTSLPPADLLQWLSANLPALTGAGSQGPAVQVHGGAGRRGPQGPPVNEARARYLARFHGRR